jgi:hypothetical protein
VPRRIFLSTLLALVVTGVFVRPADALEVRVSRVGVTASRVVATVELRDLLRDRFLQVVQQGRALFLQVQADLWEDRRLGDRLALTTPALAYRIDRAGAGGIVVTDQSGTRADHPEVIAPVQVTVDLGPAGVLADERSYYVQVTVTAATVEERDLQQASAAFLGDPQSAEGLAGLGRFVFQTLLRIGQYLDASSATARSRAVTGVAIRAGSR